MPSRSKPECSRPRRRLGATAGLLALLTGLLGGPARAVAHDEYVTAIQHRLQVTVGSRHLDVVLDLTFFEVWSERERRVMDGNADGRITAGELDAYIRRLAPRFANSLSLTVGGRTVPLEPLYDPEVDLLGNDRVVPEHHRLRLYFFAPTPAGIRPGDEIVIEDRLWPDAEILATVVVEGRDGCQLEAALPQARDHVAKGGSEPGQLFRVRCLKPPTAIAATTGTAQ